jgi:hypothetical protein
MNNFSSGKLTSLDIEQFEKEFADLTDAEKLCIFELYHEFDRIAQIVIERGQTSKSHSYGRAMW